MPLNDELSFQPPNVVDAAILKFDPKSWTEAFTAEERTSRIVGGKLTVYYSFLSYAPDYQPERLVVPFTPEQRAVMITTVIPAVESVANISLVLKAPDSLPHPTDPTRFVDTNVGEITFQNGNTGTNMGSAFQPLPLVTQVGGDLTINQSIAGNAPTNSFAGSFSSRQHFGTLVHELAHALGLSHPDELPNLIFSDGSRSIVTEGKNKQDIPADFFVGSGGASAIIARQQPTELGLYDVLGLQIAYGANVGTRAGATTYRFLPGAGDKTESAGEVTYRGTSFGAIWDGSGADWIDATNLVTASFIDLRPGYYSAIGDHQADRPALARDRNIAVAYRVNGLEADQGWIENARGGAGRDVLIGNAVANRLEGNDEGDTLDGGVAENAGQGTTPAGQGDGKVDTLVGGNGEDTFVIHFDPAAADIIEDFGRGADGTTDKIEFRDQNNVKLQRDPVGYKDASNLNLWRSTDGNWQYTLNSPLTVTHVDSGTSVVIGDAIDAFQDGDFSIHLLDAPGSDTTAANTLNGTAFNDDGTEQGGSERPALVGTGAADEIHGLLGNDVIAGGAGEDYLFGDEGGDLISGELGDDTLYGGADGDILLGWGDDDLLYSGAAISFSDAIDAGEGTAGTVREFLGGGAGNDILIGGSARDALSGGDGIDTLIAGAGDDVIWGDADLVATSLNWDTDGSSFVNVSGTIPPAGTGDDDSIYAGAGNDLVLGEAGDDYIDAGSGNDSVIGHDGHDTIFGGAGDDILNGDANLADAAHSIVASLHGDDTIYDRVRVNFAPPQSINQA